MVRPIRAPARASDSTISSVACVGRPPAAIAATTRRSGGSRSGSTTTLRSRAVSSLGQRWDEADGQAGGDDPARRERVVALERDLRLEAGLAADARGSGPGEVADGPWIQASSRRAASSIGVLARQRVRARDDRVHRLLEQRALLHVGRRLGAHAAERHREVDVAPEQLGQRLPRAALADRHLGVGEPAAQVGDRERDEPGQRRGVGGEPDAAAARARPGRRPAARRARAGRAPRGRARRAAPRPAVSSAPPRERRTSGAPTSASSAARCWETAGWVKSSAAAAPVSEPWSAIAHSERRRRRSYISGAYRWCAKSA